MTNSERRPPAAALRSPDSCTRTSKRPVRHARALAEPVEQRPEPRPLLRSVGSRESTNTRATWRSTRGAHRTAVPASASAVATIANTTGSSKIRPISETGASIRAMPNAMNAR